MSKVGHIRRRTSKYFSMVITTVGFLSATLTILLVLGLSTVVIGFIIHIILLLIIGIAIVTVSALLFIPIYTLIEVKAKSAAHSATIAILPSSLTEEKTKTKLHPTDTIEYPPPPPEDVEILRKEIVYEYLADGKTMYQRKYLEIRALRNGLTHFKDRYRWTGHGQCTVKSLTPGFRISNQHQEVEEIWEYFDVAFPFPLHESDEVSFTIEWEMIDEEKIAVTFLSTMIDRETKYLLLQVHLPPELAPKRAQFHEYTNYIDTLPERTLPIQWSPATKSISYEVKQPKKYHKYLIRWYS
jgi:hypothetical protein